MNIKQEELIKSLGYDVIKMKDGNYKAVKEDTGDSVVLSALLLSSINTAALKSILEGRA